jgi:hypothetical protein
MLILCYENRLLQPLWTHVFLLDFFRLFLSLQTLDRLLAANKTPNKTSICGGQTTPGYFGLRRRSFHADWENPRTSVLPLHSDTAAPWDKLATDLCFGCGTDERVFFPSWSLWPKPREWVPQDSNSDHPDTEPTLTISVSRPFPTKH